MHEYDELSTIHRQATAIAGILDGGVWPERVDATDGTGTVRVVLGPDGLPDSLRVGPDWRRTVGAERFADAVTEACRTAAQNRMLAWVRSLEEQDAPAAVARVQADVAASSAVVEDLPGATEQCRPRPLHLVLDDVLRETAIVIATAGKLTDAAEGTTAFGRLTMRISPDRTVSCTADPDWVSRQDANQLTDALDRALASARAGLPDTAQVPAAMARLDPLSAELTAIMRDPASVDEWRRRPDGR